MLPKYSKALEIVASIPSKSEINDVEFMTGLYLESASAWKEVQSTIA